jgi:hypothetical protein
MGYISRSSRVAGWPEIRNACFMIANITRLMNSDNQARRSRKLKEWMESQLITDLRHYQITETVVFDWTQSGGAGRKMRYMDGTLENFSRIIVFDQQGNLLADGCMEFIVNNSRPVCYWDILTVWKNGHIIREKREQGIPSHLWNVLPSTAPSKYSRKFSWM